MADPLSATFAVASLPGAFTACVDCFEYIQLGRRFGADYNRSLLKLDIARLRLSRWGESVNIYRAAAATSSTSTTTATTTTTTTTTSTTTNTGILFGKDTEKAYNILGDILELFAAAESASKRYKTRLPEEEQTVYSASADLEPDMLALHNKVRDLALTRQKSAGLRQKVAWALYDRKHFGRLIEDVTALVDGLVQLFPVAEPVQRRLCAEEVKAIEGEPALEELGQAAAAAGGVDELLSQTVQQAIAGRAGHSFTRNVVLGNARARFGDEFALGAVKGGASGHVYDSNRVEGQAKAHLGNSYGMKSILDD